MSQDIPALARTAVALLGEHLANSRPPDPLQWLLAGRLRSDSRGAAALTRFEREPGDPAGHAEMAAVVADICFRDPRFADALAREVGSPAGPFPGRAMPPAFEGRDFRGDRFTSTKVANRGFQAVRVGPLQVVALLFVLTMVVVAVLAWKEGEAEDEDALAGVAVSDGERYRVLPPSPETGLRMLYRSIGIDDRARGCMLFSEEAREKFARHTGEGTCDAAIGKYAAGVGDVSKYERPGLPRMESAKGDTVVIAGCSVLVAGGPRIEGEFVFRRTPANTWMISDFAPGAC